MRAGLERQVEHGEREHQLGEAARGLREVFREERRLPVVRGKVRPERVHGDEPRELLRDGQLVVVVLRPLLRLVELLEETVRGLQPLLLGLIEVNLLVPFGILFYRAAVGERTHAFGDDDTTVGRAGLPFGKLIHGHGVAHFHLAREHHRAASKRLGRHRG